MWFVIEGAPLIRRRGINEQVKFSGIIRASGELGANLVRLGFGVWLELCSNCF